MKISVKHKKKNTKKAEKTAILCLTLGKVLVTINPACSLG